MRNLPNTLFTLPDLISSCHQIQGPQRHPKPISSHHKRDFSPHRFFSPAAATLISTTRKRLSPRPSTHLSSPSCLISDYTWEHTPPPKVSTPQICSTFYLLNFGKNYQFFVSLLWISYLQSFSSCQTEGELIPTFDLLLQSASFPGTNAPLPAFIQLLPSCWLWQWPPTSWSSEATFPSLPFVFLNNNQIWPEHIPGEIRP